MRILSLKQEIGTQYLRKCKYSHLFSISFLISMAFLAGSFSMKFSMFYNPNESSVYAFLSEEDLIKE